MRSEFAHESPVIRSSMTPIVKQFEGSKGSVHACFEPQRSMPQVVPSPLIQEHHLGQNTGSNSCGHLLTLYSLMFGRCETHPPGWCSHAGERASAEGSLLLTRCPDWPSVGPALESPAVQNLSARQLTERSTDRNLKRNSAAILAV